MATLTLTTDDTAPKLGVQCASGKVPAILTGASAQVYVRRPGGTVISRTGVIADAINGLVELPWIDGDLTEAGRYSASVRVTYADGTKETFGPIIFNVGRSLWPADESAIPPTVQGELRTDLDATRAILAGWSKSAGDVLNPHSLVLKSTNSGSWDSTDSTSRLTVESYQTNGDNFFGEGIRLDLMDGRAKNMIAWRMARNAPLYNDLNTLRSVVWAGAHFYAQDQPDFDNPTVVHGHWSVETPDASDSLRTRFEVKFVNPSNVIGSDKTLVQTANADFVVDASNGQVLRIRSGAGQQKVIEFGNQEWGTLPRWMLGQNGTAEAGSNAGSDFKLERFNDGGTSQGTPIIVMRSTGRVIVGGTDGSQSGLDVNRNSAGNAVLVKTTATGATAVAETVQDSTSRALSVTIQPNATASHVVFGDGKHEWGPGTTRDTNLYRKSADLLATDDAVFLGNQASAPATPTAGGILYAQGGALKWIGSSGTVTTIAPA